MTTELWIYTDLAVLSVALLLTGIIIPQILHIAYSRKLFDVVDKRKVHHGVVPRLGGIAFLPAVIFAICLVLAVNIHSGHADISVVVGEKGESILFLLCAEMLIFLVGIADDLIGVRYKAKFIVQIICAIFLCASGAYITDLDGLFWIHGIPTFIGWIISGFIVVYLINAINLIDGIDGLASGLSIIALVFYGCLLTMAKQWMLALIAFALLGTLIPFFYFNVFGNPKKQKKIFMGDTGAMTVGVIISFISLHITQLGNIEFSRDYNMMILAFSPLIIPGFDVVRVYLHRIKRHRNPFLPDKCHIHHKLLALGLSQRTSLCLIILASAAFMAINILLSPYISATLLLIGDILIWIVANEILTRAIRKRERRLNTILYD